MIVVQPFEKLGAAEYGWLSARYHFSFAGYMDPQRMGLGPLRVWNDDVIRAGRGFPMHPHEDMEIVTYVRTGAITHEDSLGNKGRTGAGDVQVMSAGTGIVHSEYNLEDEDTTVFQIWIHPDARGYAPRWEARRFPKERREAGLEALASGRPGDADAGALLIHQDAAVLGAALKAGQRVEHRLGDDRGAYLVATKGALDVNGTKVAPRDGVAAVDEDVLQITAADDAEVVLVDVPYPWP